MSQPAWSVAPLHWGEGPHEFEVFLEPTCPFSARAFGKLGDFLRAAGPQVVTVKIRLQSQPWHLFSGVITRAILAASTTSGGKEAAHAVMSAVFTNRESFEFAHHCEGPNMQETPEGILARIEKLSGVAVADAFAIPDLDREMKWHCKYARQNGIHMSPTFMIDGLIHPTFSSGDSVDEWTKRFHEAKR
jgi:hypothetical protein